MKLKGHDDIMDKSAKKDRYVVDAAFAERMGQACDLHDRVPPINHGRLSYIQDELRRKWGVTASRETVRKWLAGESRPRPDKMKALAELLRVDQAWLALGIAPDMDASEKRARPIVASGAITYTAGIVAMNGGTIAFVDEDDPQAKDVHFHAIIRGRQRSFFASMAAEGSGNNIRFVFPIEIERPILLGVVKRGDIAFDIYRIPAEVASKLGVRRGGYTELVMSDDGESLTKEGFTLKRATTMADIAE